MIARRIHPRSSSTRSRGAILIIALIVTFTMSSVVLLLCQQMRVEAMSAANRSSAAQADAIERGAEQYVLARAADTTQDVFDLSEDQFAAIQVGDGYFWIVRPDYDDQSLPLFGLTDEAGKININMNLSRLMINLLEGDTDTEQSIDSWRGSSTSQDMEFYTDYPPKGAAFESVEELLLVRNITHPLLFGDGSAAPLGQRANVFSQPSYTQILTTAQAARGIEPLLTIYSKEPAAAPDGTALVKLNDKNGIQQMIADKLGDKNRAKQIVDNFRTRQNSTIDDVFDLYTVGQMKPGELDKVADYIAMPSNGLKGRINLNTAPPAVLYTLVGVNGVTSGDIDKLVAQRQTLRPAQGEVEWAADILRGKQQGLGRYVTARSYVYSADIVATSGNGRAFKHVRIVVDASSVMSGTAPQIVYRRDLSDKGWPMDHTILASLRAGQGVNSAAYASNSTLGGSKF